LLKHNLSISLYFYFPPFLSILLTIKVLGKMSNFSNFYQKSGLTRGFFEVAERLLNDFFEQPEQPFGSLGKLFFVFRVAGGC